jgi:plastocyanin
MLMVFAARISADTYRVEVGKNGLTYTPDTITAGKGDIIEFYFDGMHTVVAGDFNKPCTPVTTGGFYSGTMPMGDKVS